MICRHTYGGIYVLDLRGLLKGFEPGFVDGGVAADVQQPGKKPPFCGIVIFAEAPDFDEALLKYVSSQLFIPHNFLNHAKQGRLVMPENQGQRRLVLLVEQGDDFLFNIGEACFQNAYSVNPVRYYENNAYPV